MKPQLWQKPSAMVPRGNARASSSVASNRQLLTGTPVSRWNSSTVAAPQLGQECSSGTGAPLRRVSAGARGRLHASLVVGGEPAGSARPGACGQRPAGMGRLPGQARLLGVGGRASPAQRAVDPLAGEQLADPRDALEAGALQVRLGEALALERLV